MMYTTLSTSLPQSRHVSVIGYLPLKKAKHEGLETLHDLTILNARVALFQY